MSAADQLPTTSAALEGYGQFAHERKVSKMRKDGQLTKGEERTVCKALGILQEWLTAHQNDEHMKYGFWDLYSSHREMSNAVWITFAK